MPVGVTVQTRTARVARGIPVDTSTAFLAAKMSSGATTLASVYSMADFELAFGVRAAANQEAYDWVDTFLREGGSHVYVARYSGAATLTADALPLFTPELGPGQLSVVGETPGSTTWTPMIAHAKANNRFCLLSVANNDTVAATTTLATTLRGLSDNDYAALFGPWVNVPAPAGVIGGSARQVQATAVVAGLIARVDQLGNPNRAAMGRDFPLQYVTSLVRDFTKAEVNTLLDAGANSLDLVYGVYENYGFQTGVAQSVDTPYWQANASRGRMYIIAKAQVIGEMYVGRVIDGRRHLLEHFAKDLIGMLQGLYDADGLFGDSSQEAFHVEVGPSVNTDTTIANGEVHAALEVKLSMAAKSVVVEIVTVPLTGQIAA